MLLKRERVVGDGGSMANACSLIRFGVEGGIFLRAGEICALLNLLSVGEFGWKPVVRECFWPLRRILASLSFPSSGSDFREAAVVGGRAACPPAPAHPPLTAALRFAPARLPPTLAECQEGPVVGASAPSGGLSAHLGAAGAEAAQASAGVVPGRGHALSPGRAHRVAPRGAAASVGLEL